MNVVAVLTKKIAGFFLAILATFRRMMCFLHIVKRRKNSGSLLPITTDHQQVQYKGEIQQSLPSNHGNDLELESWDNWGNLDPSSAKPGAEEYRSNDLSNNVNRMIGPEPESEEEPDFFQDMTPEFRKSAKIRVYKKEENVRPGGLSNRLAMSSDVTPVFGGSELGQWDESENAWSSEAMEDLSWEADSALKEKKRMEREHRQYEQRKKMERERNIHKDSHLVAVKLS